MSPSKKPKAARAPVTRADLWKCKDLKNLIKQEIRAHVKDVQLARKLEQALGDKVAYGDGGGGNVAVS